MKTRWISCNACGADTYQSLSSAGEWNIGKCSSCGLTYLNPAPFFEPTSEFSLVSKGFQYTRYMHEKITPEIFAYESQQLRSQVQEIARLTGQTFPPIRYLEVGCGSGASVRAAADLGWNATGIDIDPELIAKGVEQHGADLRCTPLLQAGLDAGSFHLIRLRDVIEHLPDPYESLLEIHRLLRPGGIGLIVAPNEGALVNRLRHILRFKRGMIAFAEPPHHIHGFTPATLKRILQRAGFTILRMQTTTPVDPEYVTSNNMRSANRHFLISLWEGARVLGMGNFLVGWVQKGGVGRLLRTFPIASSPLSGATVIPLASRKRINNRPFFWYQGLVTRAMWRDNVGSSEYGSPEGHIWVTEGHGKIGKNLASIVRSPSSKEKRP